MEVQWYPGHMTKARRAMQEDISLIDLVIELVDARIPFSSRNPDIDTLAAGKSRVVLLNKADLADEKQTALWEQWFKEKGFFTACLDSRSKNQMKAVNAQIELASREKRERDLKRGIKNRPVRAMIAGIPNVGKSTFINSFAGKAVAKTGNKPGVTKGKQWIRLNKAVELLDTPGILWPKFEDQQVGVRLAVTGAIRDEILQPEELALWLIRYLREHYPDVLNARYGDGLTDGDASDLDILSRIAEVRGCLQKGGETDLARASKLLLDDFRGGRLGRLTLEEVMR